MSVATTVYLTDEQEAFARSLVEAGRFPDVESVLRRGLELMRNEHPSVELERGPKTGELLRRLIETRRKGPFISDEESRAETDRLLEHKRVELGLPRRTLATE